MLPAILVAGLLGTGGAGGAVTAILGSHVHPELLNEIRELEYESEIYKLSVAISAMEGNGQRDSADYAVAVSQLQLFTAKLTNLGP